jgi:hypothetical protein
MPPSTSGAWVAGTSPAMTQKKDDRKSRFGVDSDRLRVAIEIGARKTARNAHLARRSNRHFLRMNKGIVSPALAG